MRKLQLVDNEATKNAYLKTQDGKTVADLRFKAAKEYMYALLHAPETQEKNEKLEYSMQRIRTTLQFAQETSPSEADYFKLVRDLLVLVEEAE